MRREADANQFRNISLETQRPGIPDVVEQHVGELASLWTARAVLETSGHASLLHLTRVDERVLAHEDGCCVAGSAAWAAARQRMVEPSSPDLFAATLVALDLLDPDALEQCVALAEALAETVPGVASALGWVSAGRLTGIGKQLLEAPSPVRRHLGLAACRSHGVDPLSLIHI